MGYVVGQGLGKNGEGRAEPVPIQLLPAGQWIYSKTRLVVIPFTAIVYLSFSGQAIKFLAVMEETVMALFLNKGQSGQNTFKN